MSLFDVVKADQLQARKERHVVAAGLLTTLMGEILARAKKENRDVIDEDVTATVKKFSDNLAELQENIREDRKKYECFGIDPRIQKLADAEVEATILSRYMPTKLTEEELTNCVREAIAMGHTSVGPVMAYLKEHYTNRYDGKLASAIIKKEVV